MADWKKVVLAKGTSTQYIKGDGTFATYTDSLPLTGGTVSGDVVIKSNNGNASHTLLKIHNNDEPSGGETGQTADIEFQFQGSTNSGSSFVTKNAGAIRAGKDTDYHTASADNMDSHLKFYTAQDNVNTLALTIDSNQNVTFADKLNLHKANGTGLTSYIGIRDSGTSSVRSGLGLGTADSTLVLYVDKNNAIGSGSALVLQTGGTDALTINGSQNATFAGSITAQDALFVTASDNVAKFESSDAIARIVIEDNASENNGNWIAVQNDVMSFATNGSNTALTLGSDQQATFSNHINLGDNVKALFGNSNDLQIYHTGTHSYINEGGTGNLIIAQGSNTAVFSPTSITLERDTTVSGKISVDEIEGRSNTTNTLLLNDDQTASVNMVTMQSINHINMMTDGNNNGVGSFKVLNGSYDVDTADVAFEIGSDSNAKFAGDVTIKSTGSNDDPATLALWSPDTSIAENDTIGVILAQGSDSGSSPPYLGGKIEFNADAVWDTGTTGYYATRIDFFTESNNGATATANPRMTINSSGNVGIGTTSPMANSDGIVGLEISSGASTGLTLKSTSSSQIYSLWADASGNLKIQDNTNNVTPLTIESNQNARFSKDLTVGDSVGSGGFAKLAFKANTSASGRYANITKEYDSPFTFQIEASSSATTAPIVFKNSNAQTALTLDTSGNAIFAQDVKLGISKKIYGQNNSTNSIEFYNGSTGAMNFVSGTASYDYPMEFRQNDAQVMTIKSQRVGIGTQSPSQKLHVSGSTVGQAKFHSTGSSGARIYISDASAESAIKGGSSTLFFEPVSGTANASISTTKVFLGKDAVGQNTTTELGGYGVLSTNGLRYGNYGWLTFNAPTTNYTASSRGWALTNGYKAHSFAILKSSSASTEPYLATSGEVGTGTTAPLVIDNSGNTTLGGNLSVDGNLVSLEKDIGGNASYVRMNYNMPNSTDDAYGHIGMQRTSSTTYLGMLISSDSRDGIRFNTANGTPVERMRIDASGRVGIGVDSPTKTLELNGSYKLGSNAFINYNATYPYTINVENTAGVGNLTFQAGTGSTGFKSKIELQGGNTATDASITLTTADTARMTILNNGNVGIGTTSPSNTLHLSASVPVIRLTDSDTGDYHRIYGSNGGLFFDADKGVSGGTATSVIGFGVDDSQVMTLVSGGNVGIGTESPSSSAGVGRILHIAHTSHAGIVLQDTNSTAHEMYSADGHMYFYSQASAGNTVMIDKGGDVGIGSTNPRAKLHVAGGTASNGDGVYYYNNVAFKDGGSSETGTLKITLPQYNSTTMLKFTIEGYNYSGGSRGTSWTVETGGYIYNNNDWYNYYAHIRGRAPFDSVRLSHDGSKNVILLGTTSTTWAYPKIVITEVLAGFNNEEDWGSGYSMSWITSETGIGSNIYTPKIDYRLNSSGDSIFGGRIRHDGELYINPTTNLRLLGNVMTFGNVGSTEYARFDSSGRFGIGTSSPAGDIHISNNSPMIIFDDEDVTNLRHRIAGGGNVGLEYASDMNNVGTGYHRWEIGGSVVMKLIEGGSLSIGDPDPLAKLHVEIPNHNDAVGFYNGATALVYMRNESGTGRLTLQGSGGTINLESSNSRNSYINAGSLGIGTTTPSGKLDLGGGTSGQTLCFSNTGVNTTDGARVQANIKYKTGSYSGQNTIQIITETQYDDSSAVVFNTGASSTERMRINYQGKVGIGTDSPDKLLHVSGSDNVLATFESTDSHATIRLIDSDTTNQVTFTRVGDDLEIVKDGGNVGIGKDNPTQALDVEGSIISSEVLLAPTYATFIHSFYDDMGTTAHYLPWGNLSEGTSNDSSSTSFLVPMNMSLVKLFVRIESITNPNNHNLTVTLISKADGTITNTTVASATKAFNINTSNKTATYLASDFNTTPRFTQKQLGSIKVQFASDIGAGCDFFVTSVWEIDNNTL